MFKVFSSRIQRALMYTGNLLGGVGYGGQVKIICDCLDSTIIVSYE